MHRGWGASHEHYDTIEEALSCALEATLGERYDEPTPRVAPPLSADGRDDVGGISRSRFRRPAAELTSGAQ